MTKVKFYKDKDGDIFAYFPDLPFNNEPGMFTCYAHIGQHSACHESYAMGCIEAAYFEYWELLRELIGQGYKDLQVLNSAPIQYHRIPTPSEIKQGYGATHYREFQPVDFINPKTGLIKHRIKADDGLIYTY